MLKVENLTKKYQNFTLDNACFELPKGYIMGFLGKNGAGKTTLLKCILNVVRADSGTAEYFGLELNAHECEIKQDIGFVPGAFDYYPKTVAAKIKDAYKIFFKNWSEDTFLEYAKKFSLDISKKISEFSTGMRVKFGLALALSHNAKLLILDEPTSGLDPIARDELLDILRGIIEDGERSVIFSTHITSDLDKCADYIMYIKEGKIVFVNEKDTLINSYALIKGGKEDFDALKEQLAGYKENSYGFSGLISREKLKASGLKIAAAVPNLEEIMIYLERGNR